MHLQICKMVADVNAVLLGFWLAESVSSIHQNPFLVSMGSWKNPLYYEYIVECEHHFQNQIPTLF